MMLRRSGCCLSVLLTMVACGWSWSVKAEEPISPIGALLINPSAFHRKLLKLQGVATEVKTYSKYEVTSVCGAHFKLTDETGTIEVSYPLRCQIGEDRATFVFEGIQVIVEGSMEAPSSVVRNSDGKENEFGIFAQSVVPAGK
jgi:hypothetical protein